MGLFTPKHGPIGLDLGHHRIKAVQLSYGKARPVARATACFDRLTPGQPLSVGEARRIAEVLSRRGFVGNRVVLSVPNDALIEAVLEVPPLASHAPREQIVRMELSRQHRLAPDGVEVAFWPLPNNEHAGQREQVMAVGFSHDHASALIGPLDGAGLEVVQIEPACTALLRACRASLTPMEHIGAIADLGASGFRLLVVFAGRIVHQRALPFAGCCALAESLQDLFQGSVPLSHLALQTYGLAGSQTYDLGAIVETRLSGVAEDLIEQIGMSFAYVSHQYPAAELGPLMLTGGAALLPGLSNVVSDRLRIPVYTATPANYIDADQVQAKDLLEPAATLATGLAMNGGAW